MSCSGRIAVTLLGAFCLAACSETSLPREPAAPAPSPASTLVMPEPAFPGRRPTMQEASAHFTSHGAQPGDRLPPLSLVGLDGRPVDVAAFAHGRPLLLVTCSITCNIARRQTASIAELRRRLGDAAAIALVYTIDAHPKGDVCPYTGEEWVPPANDQDGVLLRQPRTLDERLLLARRYAEKWADGTTVFVDTMDNASWRALGEAPHAGVCVGADGVVAARSGWFDLAKMEASLSERKK